MPERIRGCIDFNSVVGGLPPPLSVGNQDFVDGPWPVFIQRGRNVLRRISCKLKRNTFTVVDVIFYYRRETKFNQFSYER